MIEAGVALSIQHQHEVYEESSRRAADMRASCAVSEGCTAGFVMRPGPDTGWAQVHTYIPYAVSFGLFDEDTTLQAHLSAYLR